MAKHTYVIWIPITAQGKFILHSDKKLTDAEVRDLMPDKGQFDGSICHQCSDGIETDGEAD